MFDESNQPLLAKYITSYLRKGYAIFTGSHDKEFGSLIIFPDIVAETLSDDIYVALVRYFTSLSSVHISVPEFTVVVDRRTDSWKSVEFIVDKLNCYFPGILKRILILKPQSWFERFVAEKTLSKLRKESKILIYFMDKSEELTIFIDKSHLTNDLNGELRFDIHAWLDNRMQIEEFSLKVDELCWSMLEMLKDFSSPYATNTSATGHPNTINDFYSIHNVLKVCKQGYAWLHSVECCESEGLELRKYLIKQNRSTPTLEESKMDSNCATINECSPHTEGSKSLKTHPQLPPDLGRVNTKGDSYNLSADLVFHVINLERILVRLTEARTDFNNFRRRFIKCACVARFIREIQFQYDKLRLLSNVGDNLIESVRDYLPSTIIRLPNLQSPVQGADSDVNTASITASGHYSFDLTSHDNCAGDQTSLSANYLSTSDVGKFSSNNGSYTGMESELEFLCDPYRLEGLETLACRICKAQQFGTALLPCLSKLIELTNLLISHITYQDEEKIIICVPTVDTDALLADITNLSLKADKGVGDLNNSSRDSFEFDLLQLNSSVSKTMDDLDYPIWNHLCEEYGLDNFEFDSNAGMDSFHCPDLQLPLDVHKWVPVFEHFIELINSKLPKSSELIQRLLQLYKEINSAREWLSYGRSLIDTVTPANKLNTMDMVDCRTHLDKLISFKLSRETNLQLFNNPKLFRSKLTGLVNPELSCYLTELLKKVEDLEQLCNDAIASLSQLISRVNFPRHPIPITVPGNTTTTTVITTSVSTESISPTNLKIKPSTSDLNNVQSMPSVDKKSIASVDLTPFSLTDPVVIQPSQPDFGIPVANAVKQYQLAWSELLNTERNYVNFLQNVYDVVWLGAFNPVNTDVGSKNAGSSNLNSSTNNGCVKSSIPTFMHDNQSRLLVNWPDLLCFHRDSLLPSLEVCDGDAVKLKHWAYHIVPRLVDLYSVYCAVYENAVQIAVQLERDRIHSTWINTANEEIYRRESTSMPEHQPSNLSNLESVRPMLCLSSRLVTPVQRFQRYHLLLDRLVIHETNDENQLNLKATHKAFLEMCETVNVTMRLRGLSFRPSDLGRLLLEGDFTISRDDARLLSSQQRHVFLFSNALLLTKFRNSAGASTSSSIPNTVLALTSINSHNTTASLTSDHSTDLTEKSTSNQSLPTSQSASNPIVVASNLLALTKSLATGSGSNNSLNASSQYYHSSGPVYDIKQELLLAQVGLTPSIREDRRRFAVWTANRAHTYIFQSADPLSRDKWVRSINELLMAQLRRLRDEALQRQHFHSRKIFNESSATTSILSDSIDRSKSLPPCNKCQPKKKNSSNGSVLSLPIIADQPNKQKH